MSGVFSPWWHPQMTSNAVTIGTDGWLDMSIHPIRNCSASKNDGTSMLVNCSLHLTWFHWFEELRIFLSLSFFRNWQLPLCDDHRQGAFWAMSKTELLHLTQQVFHGFTDHCPRKASPHDRSVQEGTLGNTQSYHNGLLMSTASPPILRAMYTSKRRRRWRRRNARNI